MLCLCPWLHFLSSLPFWQRYNLSISKTSETSLTLPPDSQPYLFPFSSLGTVPPPHLGAALAWAFVLPFLKTASGNILASTLSYAPKGAGLPSRFLPLIQWPVLFTSPQQTWLCPPLIHQTNHVTKPSQTPLGFLDPLLHCIKQKLHFQGSKVLYDPVLVFH